MSPAWFVTQVPRDRRRQLCPVLKICKPTLEEQDQRAAPRSPLSRRKVVELETTVFVADSALEWAGRGLGVQLQNFKGALGSVLGVFVLLALFHGCLLKLLD